MPPDAAVSPGAVATQDPPPLPDRAVSRTAGAGGPWAVELRGLRKVHGGGDRAVTALDGVSIGFGHGTFTAVMGPSGSGKSTLLQCAAGLDAPTGGHVLLGGTDVGALSETARTVLRRDRVGFVFQELNLVTSLTAAQNVELPARLGRRRVPAADVDAALAQVGLADRARHRPSEMSGGQQQRVAIARALLGRPEVLFADEPTGALDTRTSHEVLALLRRLVDRWGQTTLMVTHDPVAAAYADEVVVLADGRVADRIRNEPGHSDTPARIAAAVARSETARSEPARCGTARGGAAQAGTVRGGAAQAGRVRGAAAQGAAAQGGAGQPEAGR
ncbi:putative ABC transport system ATP-binding protein [Pseudonocardia sediminis]|uniref:Putative ABC transport system ATP-binding protein n=1 Tax=Pseudonocardia sediminis TaxID=1397368 RepID=A0A4V2FQW2_PSEST|nr:putative ABC transport system ATP-binding protein [Pseudonocardia sediminis]